ncbi:MAG: hypothetical protein MJE68_01575 [Proteobacteria bacterium]|nr:hypothetical protein [Pseudomonadota bacterium]
MVEILLLHVLFLCDDMSGIPEIYGILYASPKVKDAIRKFNLAVCIGDDPLVADNQKGKGSSL